MKRIDIGEFKERASERYDTDTICDMLDITVEDLIEAFWDRVVDKREDFYDIENPESNDE